MVVSFVTFSFLSIMTHVVQFEAHADGIFQETLPPASVNGRQISLFIKINPPILTSENIQDRYLFIRVFDANTNQTIQHDSIQITITKHDQLLVRELFHTHTGYLTLRITPTNTIGQWTVYGNENFVLGWMADEGGNIDLLAPVLGESGLYHIHMELIFMDTDKSQFAEKDIPKFDSALSVGDVANNIITYHENTYNTNLISYYDKTSNFNFDPSNLQASWSMPFDWNTTRFQNMPIYVHEELHIPKSFKEFSSTPTYVASVNGEPITGRRLIVDPYSQGNTIIAHILLNKPDILNLAKKMPAGTNTMNFTLAPATPNVKTSSSVLTDFGGWGIKLGWNPTQIAPNSQNNLQLVFFDAFTEQQVGGDVNYDLKILDNNGDTMVSKINMSAKSGKDSQVLNLPGNGIYRLEINVKSIVNYGIPDTSRIGIARGDIVIPSTAVPDSGGVNNTIPELPSNPTMVLVVSIAFVIGMMYYTKTRNLMV